MKLLENKDDFFWHKKKLDVNNKYNHDHFGEPAKYPCKVVSRWGDDPNGPYYYTHSFIYQEEVICDKCGHKKTIWPNVEDLL